MNVPATIFEGIMILCWGISWPAAVIKTYKTKNVEGISILFLWFVFLGYISGLMFKMFEALGSGHINPVTILYIINLVFVGSELVMYYKYRKVLTA